MKLDVNSEWLARAKKIYDKMEVSYMMQTGFRGREMKKNILQTNYSNRCNMRRMKVNGNKIGVGKACVQF